MKRALQYGLRRAERHAWFNRFRQWLDAVVSMAVERQYRGDNPAMAAAYGPMRVALWVMLLLAVVLFGLGSVVPIESAAVARGTIVVSSNKKTIQHLEGGVIRAILVEEGALVQKGQALVELSDIAPKASRNIAQNDMFAAQIAQARLLALKNDETQMTLDATILKAATGNRQLADTILSQRDQFQTQKEAQESKIQTLQQRIKQYDEEIIGLEAQVKSATAQVRMMAQEIAPMRRLVAKGYASKPQLLALTRHQEELLGNKGQNLAAIAKARQSITETELQVQNARNDFAAAISEELRTIQTRISEDEEKLHATSDVVSRMLIRAPYEGVVTGLRYHTIGGVITPGTPIMDIIPQNDTLMVEARIQPTDIDVVHAGLPTKLSFSAFNSRRMPRLAGKVVYVSADAFSATEEEKNSATYYTARIEVSADELAKLDTHLVLTPGMPVEAYIRTGSRSFLGYLMAPISSSIERAFVED